MILIILFCKKHDIAMKSKYSPVCLAIIVFYSLYSIYCSLPPLNEQNEIINHIKEKTEIIDNVIDRKEGLILELESYKKSLIYEYVTGKKEAPL